MTHPTARVPLTLVRHQMPMLATLGRITIDSSLPGRRPSTNPDTFQPAESVIPPPPNDLVDHYIAWSGGGDRYRTTLPPHMVSQWSLPIATRILRQSRYTLTGIINQGVTLTINGDLPRGVPLQLHSHLLDLEEDQGRTRIAVALATGTQSHPNLVETVLHVAFGVSSKDRRKRPQEQREEPDWQDLGTWRATTSDGLRFAILTGDFNPIHWVGIAGKASPFKTKVLHGFGMFARTYEVLRSQHDLSHLDVRFLKPVPLPSGELMVEKAEGNHVGEQHVRLVDAKGRPHLAGTYRAHST